MHTPQQEKINKLTNHSSEVESGVNHVPKTETFIWLNQSILVRNYNWLSIPTLSKHQIIYKYERERERN